MTQTSISDGPWPQFHEKTPREKKERNVRRQSEGQRAKFGATLLGPAFASPSLALRFLPSLPPRHTPTKNTDAQQKKQPHKKNEKKTNINFS